MRPFSGVEPLVGEIVGLRTFRVDDQGLLLPLYSNLSWYDGANTATCAPPTGEQPRGPGRDGGHAVPFAQCQCGFYAYGTEAAAAQHRQMRYVQAVVSCWGAVVAGTQGIRAEHARIDAIWLHPNIAPWARRRVAGRYPSARMYSDRAEMLASHPLSRLGCYEPPVRRRVWPRAAAFALASVVLALGLTPLTALHASPALWTAWLAATSCVSVLAVWLLTDAAEIGHRAGAMLAVGILAWLLAPLLGVAGWLLRLPVLRTLVVVAAGFVTSLRPGYFPIDRAGSDRTSPVVRN